MAIPKRQKITPTIYHFNCYIIFNIFDGIFSVAFMLPYEPLMIQAKW